MGPNPPAHWGPARLSKGERPVSEVKMGNPAVVGLAGFGLTTITLQLHNLGLCGVAPVIWLGLCFGGTAQLIAGLLEFRTGNNFGFCAFTGYGAFWISLCLMLVFGTNADLISRFPSMKFGATELGYYLVMWTIFTAILFLIAMKHHGTLALIFFTLVLGFIGLDLKELGGSAAAGTFAAYILLVCGALALYLMAATVAAESGINLPLGAPWIK